MGYYIRLLNSKKSKPQWKLQYISQKKEHTHGAKCRTWDIPHERWSELGFRTYMTIGQARIRQRQLNAQINLKRHEERKLKFEEEAKDLELACAGYLPDVYREQFEERYFGGKNPRRFRKSKELSHWRAAQKIILEIQLEPSDWYDEALRIYDWLHEKRYSFQYLCKILRIVNLWGFFISRKLGKPFLSIPIPQGLEKRRLLEAYFSKKKRVEIQSDPLTPHQLEQARSKLRLEHYNWLYISVWLGLRPLEIDSLSDPAKYRIKPDLDGSLVIWVYQTKLISVPPRYRWKLIPIFLEEQKQVLEILKSGIFHRPLTKTVKAHFGPNTTLYGGRKGFSDLMLSYGQDFFNISQWMGHSTIQMTWKNYKSRLLVHYERTPSSKGMSNAAAPHG